MGKSGADLQGRGKPHRHELKDQGDRKGRPYPIRIGLPRPCRVGARLAVALNPRFVVESMEYLFRTAER